MTKGKDRKREDRPPVVVAVVVVPAGPRLGVGGRTGGKAEGGKVEAAASRWPEKEEASYCTRPAPYGRFSRSEEVLRRR
jgi:hypothetical protein